MRDLPRSRVDGASAAWLLLPLACLTLPNCSFSQTLTYEPPNDAIFCDIEWPFGRQCATDEDLDEGIPLSHAALALASRATSPIGLDDSPEALARCGGRPEAVRYRASFPEGLKTCVKWLNDVGPSPAPYADAQAVCVNRCQRFFGSTDADGRFVPDGPSDPSVRSFCLNHAKVSTNSAEGFGGLCAVKAEEFDDPMFPHTTDPRRIPELVRWGVLGVTAGPPPFNDKLTRTAPTSQPPAFDAGATSFQLVTRGDAFLEVTATGPVTERVIGFGRGLTAPSLSDFVFGLDLSNGGFVYVIENGQVTAFLGSYAVGDQFRVAIDGDGMKAYRNGALLHTSNTEPSYPLRVAASMIEQGATLAYTRIIYIK